MVNVLESTLECMDIRRGIVNFGIGSHTSCFSLDSFFHVKSNMITKTKKLMLTSKALKN
jgi:hypothetical protein